MGVGVTRRLPPRDAMIVRGRTTHRRVTGAQAISAKILPTRIFASATILAVGISAASVAEKHFRHQPSRLVPWQRLPGATNSYCRCVRLLRLSALAMSPRRMPSVRGTDVHARSNSSGGHGQGFVQGAIVWHSTTSH